MKTCGRVLVLCCLLAVVAMPVYGTYDDVWHAREEKMEEASIMFQLFFSNADEQATKMLKWYVDNKDHLSRKEQAPFRALDRMLEECDRNQHAFMDAYWFYHLERTKNDRDLDTLQKRWEIAERTGIRVDKLYVMMRTLWWQMSRVRKENYQTEL